VLIPNNVLKIAHPKICVQPSVDTYAIFAAPKMPNLIASLFFSTAGGPKAVKTRFTNDTSWSVLMQVIQASRWSPDACKPVCEVLRVVGISMHQ
jgi:hypothetical protein